jgi:hypothetical protein
MSYIRINTIDELKDCCRNNTKGFFIHFGLCRSSKTILYNDEAKTFWVHNEIDDTAQTLTEIELETKSNIAKSIEIGSFYRDEWINDKK